LERNSGMDIKFDKSIKSAVDMIKVPDYDVDSFFNEEKRRKSAERIRRRVFVGTALFAVIIAMASGVTVYAASVLQRQFRSAGNGSPELIVDDYDPQKDNGENPGNAIVWEYSKPDTDFEAPEDYKKHKLYDAAPSVYTFASWKEMASEVPFPIAEYKGEKDGWALVYDSVGGDMDTFVTGTYEETGRSIEYLQSHFANDHWGMGLGIDQMGLVKEQKTYQTKEGYSYTLSIFSSGIDHIYAALALQYDMITVDFRGYSEPEVIEFLEQLSMQSFGR